MSLAPGTKLGPYEIGVSLGAGGMGEVYRARDTRLDRTVAIKILPQQFTADPVSKQRFEREAKTVSGLNHPNICVLYDIGHQDGVDYIVMEFLEGESLAKRLEKGPIALDQVLKYGEQVGRALDKAHMKGIVHRDLKPGNIMLTATGAKLLDFGLAKEAAPLVSDATLTAKAISPVTQQGTIVGTFQYMSPEQLQGKELDGRSDIFSLGAVLYEMLTGKRAFEGRTQLSVASAILEKEPAPPSSFNPLAQASFDRTIRRCLAKDPDARWQSASDLACELQWIGEANSQANEKVRGVGKNANSLWFAWGVALAALLTAGVFGLWLKRQTPVSGEVYRYSIPAPPGESFLFGGFHESPALSSDGRKIVFIARSAGVARVWVRSLDSLDAHVLAGTEDADSAFWSPDSENLAFVANGKIKRVSAAGGPVQTICEADGSFRGGTWSREDVILFGSTPGPVYRVSASGGVPQGVTTLGSKRHDLLHRWPSFLPDGKHFFYLASQAATLREDDAVFVSSLDGKEEKMLLHTSSPVAYANGYLFYLSNQTLMARPFDPEKIEFTGNAVSVVEGVLIDPYFGGAVFSVSRNGVLLYQLGAPFSGYSLALVNRDGKELSALRDPGMYFFPRISPDGRRVAYHSPDLQGGNTDVWVWDIATGNRKRLSFNPAYNRTPVWSPDGMRIAYIASESGRNTVFLKPVDTMGAEEKSAELPTGVPSLTQWTPDGKDLLFDDTALETRQLRIDVVPVTGSGAVVPLMESASANIGAGTVSADGRWLAYRSTETGKGEVYITSFPKPSGKLQVSVAGGGGPRWRADGKELFYLGADRKLMMVAELKESGGSLQVASVHALFQAPMMSTRRNAHYDVTADGTKFVLQRVTGDEASAPLNIVVNWPAELKTK